MMYEGIRENVVSAVGRATFDHRGIEVIVGKIKVLDLDRAEGE